MDDKIEAFKRGHEAVIVIKRVLNMGQFFGNAVNCRDLLIAHKFLDTLEKEYKEAILSEQDNAKIAKTKSKSARKTL